MSKKTINIKSLKETKQFAESFAKEILDKPKGRSLVLALEGELWAGKTTFTQALGKEFGINKSILSPTFVISKRFPLKNKPFKNLYHIDVYRVGYEIGDMGLKDFMSEPNLLVIEWADKIRDILPKDTVWIKFEHGKEGTERKITINRR